MASLNQAILIGHLGKDPELRHTPSGVPVAAFSIATSESYKDSGGNKKEQTEWHSIVAWNALGENCAKYIKKGSKVLVEGKIKTDCYDKGGEKHYRTKIVAHKVLFLDLKKEGGEKPAKDDDHMPDIPF